jgi:hypothetical protein
MALVIAVDTSNSMSFAELQAQRRGYAEALNGSMVLDAIAGGRVGRIAVTYVEWSDRSDQRVTIPWTLIDGPGTAHDFASRIGRNVRVSGHKTSLSRALEFSASLIAQNPFPAQRHVIDISGDGPNNSGGPVVAARDAVTMRGITINGLPLIIERAGERDAFEDLDEYFAECVIGGPQAFMLPVYGWEQFPEALELKLAIEIAGSTPPELSETVADAEAYNCMVGEQRLPRNGR